MKRRGGDVQRWGARLIVGAAALSLGTALATNIGAGANAPTESSVLPRVHALESPMDQYVLGTPVRDVVSDQISVYDRTTGRHLGTVSERFARPCLSLCKLYIAEYVYAHGSDEQQRQATTMLRASDDDIATELFRAFPSSIDTVAKQYHLSSTFEADGRWGYSFTSMYDVVSFVAQLLESNPDSPVLAAMRRTDPVAADGSKQNFGTAVLPDAEGSKFGWSNAKDLHASVTFGPNYVAAAAVYGSADDLTKLVRREVLPFTQSEPWHGSKREGTEETIPKPRPERTTEPAPKASKSSRTSRPATRSTESRSRSTGDPSPKRSRAKTQSKRESSSSEAPRQRPQSKRSSERTPRPETSNRPR